MNYQAMLEMLTELLAEIPPKEDAKQRLLNWKIRLKDVTNMYELLYTALELASQSGHFAGVNDARQDD